MTGLPWVRLDANIASHDKILAALQTRQGKGAIAVYMFSIAWSGGHATDGHIPHAALPLLHGTRTDATILEQAGLWERNGNGWHIRNYAERQELATITEWKREKQAQAGRRTNCKRWHGPECGCWKKTQDA